MVNKLAAAKPVAALPAAPTAPKTAAAAPTQTQGQTQAKNDPVTNPQLAAKPVATAPLPAAQNAPRSLTSPAQANNGVVMQAVPNDPLAGPVKAASSKPATAKKEAAKSDTAKDSKTADAQSAKPDVKPVDAKPAAQPAPVTKTADKSDGVPALRLAADALTP
jgi:hypothetical protein